MYVADVCLLNGSPGDEPRGVVQLVHDPGPGHHGVEHGEGEPRARAHGPRNSLTPRLVAVEVRLVEQLPAVVELGLVRSHPVRQHA